MMKWHIPTIKGNYAWFCMVHMAYNGWFDHGERFISSGLVWEAKFTCPRGGGHQIIQIHGNGSVENIIAKLIPSGDLTWPWKMDENGP